jgi:hypothetical protein
VIAKPVCLLFACFQVVLLETLWMSWILARLAVT